MNNHVDYERFPKVREALNGCYFATQEQKELAFRTLVRCLVDKHVFRADGKVVKERLDCLNYLVKICPRLKDEELDLILTEPNTFYDRFVFAPGKNAKSLFSELRKPSVDAKFKRVSFDELCRDYRDETGCSPYEKISEDVLDVFISQVEALYL